MAFLLGYRQRHHNQTARVVNKYTDSNGFYNAELTGGSTGYKVGVNREGCGRNWSLTFRSRNFTFKF